MSILQILPRRLRLLSPQILFAIAAIILFSFLAHGAGLWNGFAMLDDGLLIFKNNVVRDISPQTLHVIFTSYDPELYIPLTFLTYQIEYQIAGYSPFIFHFTNLLLHTGSALLLFTILRRLSVVRSARYPFLIAFAVSLLFAVHPMHVEAVAWAAARKDVLTTFFFLLSLYAYCVSCKEGVGGRASGVGWYGVSVGAFLLALLAKVTVVVLPILLLLIDWSEGRLRRPNIPRVLLKKVPYLLLAAIFGVVALFGKLELLEQITLVEKILLACRMTLFSLGKILFPLRLSVYYPVLEPINLASPAFLTAALGLLAFGGFLVLLRRNRMFLFGMIFFIVAVSPSFFTSVKGGNIFLFSDRYAYIPSIGIFLALLALLISMRWLTRCVILCGVGVLCVLFTFSSIRQTRLWGNSVELYRQATAYAPDFYMGHISLGASLRQAGDKAGAIQEYRRSIALHPMANTIALIGQVKAEDGDFEGAKKEFEQAIAMDPAKSELHYGMGQLLALMGKTDEALAEYELALSLAPPEAQRYRMFARDIASRRDMVELRIGILLGTKGDTEGAMTHFDRALAENPWNTEAEYNLAVALGNTGRTDDAILHYKRAVKLDPMHIPARMNLGMMLVRRGRTAEAAAEFRAVLRVDPKNAEALRLLGGMEG